MEPVAETIALCRLSAGGFAGHAFGGSAELSLFQVGWHYLRVEDHLRVIDQKCNANDTRSVVNRYLQKWDRLLACPDRLGSLPHSDP